VKKFTESDIEPHGSWDGVINADRSELVDAPPDWMKRGLSETASGYGRRLNSGLKIHFEGRLHRIYTTIFSNSGTNWFNTKGRKIVVR
jgi:hypothetical protein